MLCDIVYPCVSFAPGDVSNKASALIVVGFVVVALYLSWLYVEWDSARSRHRQLRRRAARGETQAQYELGLPYCEQRRRAGNAAEQGHAEARHRLCMLGEPSPEPLSDIPPGLICDDKVTQRLFAVRRGED